MNHFYVYAHHKVGCSEPFYIGKGHGKRVNTKGNRNKWWHHIVNKHGYKVTILHKNLSEIDALTLEVSYIQCYGRLDIGTGCLVNMTDGGDGISGYKRSPQAYRKWRKSLKGHKLPPRTEEHKRNLSLALKGKIITAEQRAKTSNALLGHKTSDETKIKIGNANRGKVRSAELRNRISQTLKQKFGRKGVTRK